MNNKNKSERTNTTKTNVERTTKKWLRTTRLRVKRQIQLVKEKKRVLKGQEK